MEQVVGIVTEVDRVFFRGHGSLGAFPAELGGHVKQLARAVAMMVGEFAAIDDLQAQRVKRAAKGARVAQSAEHADAPERGLGGAFAAAMLYPAVRRDAGAENRRARIPAAHFALDGGRKVGSLAA